MAVLDNRPPKRRWILAVALGLLGAALAAGGALAAAKAPAHSAGATAKTPIVIGVADALTGPYSGYDLGVNGFIRLAVHDINAKGGVLGHPLKIVYSDTKSDVTTAGVSATHVIDKGAKLVITQCEFTHGAPGALVAQQHKIPAFTCATDPKFGPPGIGKYGFSFSVSAMTEGTVQAEWSHKHGFRSTYMLTDNSISYSRNDCAYFKDVWTKLPGTSILGEDSFQNSDTSIATQIAKIKALPKQPDFISLCTYLPGVISAVRQIRAAGITAPIVTGESSDFRGGFAAIPHLSNFYNVEFASIYGNDPNKAINNAFARDAKLNGKPATTSLDMFGYCMIQGWALAVKKAGTTNGPAVVKALETFRNQPLLCGHYTFTTKLHILVYAPMAIIGVKNGKPYFVTRFTPTRGSVPPEK